MYPFLLLFLTLTSGVKSAIKDLHQSDGDLIIALLVHNCVNSTRETPFVEQSLVSSAIWTVKRVNFLQYNAPKFAVKAFQVCDDKDELKVIFDLYQKQDRELFLGAISDRKLSNRICRISEILNVKMIETRKCLQELLQATLMLLKTLNWTEGVTVLAPDATTAQEFARMATLEWICIKDIVVYQNAGEIALNATARNWVVLGRHKDLDTYLKSEEPKQNKNIIFVPLDGSILTNLPAGAYAVVPPHTPLTLNYRKSAFFTTPLLFEVALPLLTFTENIDTVLGSHCNETNFKLNCLKTISFTIKDLNFEAMDAIDLLKIAPLKTKFLYNIYKAENETFPYTKIFEYSFFDKNLTLMTDSEYGLLNVSANCDGFDCFSQECKNYEKAGTNWVEIRIRTEPWMFAFLSLSLLGVLLCIAILIFFLVAICRRDILEGNPLMTIVLLIAVIFIYCSIIPLSLKPRAENSEQICLARSLTITLSFSLAFALILSRSILLATASKDIGFMTHLAGPVQSFLCLFIFGVQAALSLQILGHCTDIFHEYSFLYLLSYNAMLLLLQLCLIPLIYKCERNYREGKYFSIAAALIVLLWAVWLPAFVLVEKDIKDSVLCFGLISTGTVIIGTIFIPRTYLMTMSAARDKITSAMPSMATANSTLDIYRSGTQPVYDCVNVAALGALGISRPEQPDLYNCAAYPDEDDFDFRCDTPPVNNDKVTRF